MQDLKRFRSELLTVLVGYDMICYDMFVGPICLKCKMDGFQLTFSLPGNLGSDVLVTPPGLQREKGEVAGKEEAGERKYK